MGKSGHPLGISFCEQDVLCSIFGVECKISSGLGEEEKEMKIYFGAEFFLSKLFDFHS